MRRLCAVLALLLNLGFAVPYCGWCSWAVAQGPFIQSAERLEREKNFAAAARAYGEAIKIVGRDKQVDKAKLGQLYFKRGYCYQRSGASEEAVLDLERSVSLGHRGKHLERYLGEAYLNTSQFDKAIEVINEGIKKSTGKDQKRLYTFYALRAGAYKGKGDDERQLADLTRAVECCDKPARLLKERAIYFEWHKQWQKAIADFDAIEAIEPLTASGLNSRARCKMELKRYAEAVKDYSRSIALEPKKAGLYVARAKAYRLCGKPDLADADLKVVQSLGEDFELEIGKRNRKRSEGKTPADRKK